VRRYFVDRLRHAVGSVRSERDRSAAFDEQGDLDVAQGNLPGALDNFWASLRISEGLAQADPGNAQWLRDLSVA
jgi:hypothetical protein